MAIVFVGSNVFRGERNGCWLAAERCEQVESVKYPRKKLPEWRVCTRRLGGQILAARFRAMFFARANFRAN